MTTGDITRLPAAAGPLDRSPEANAAQAAQITEALNQIVDNSRRKSSWRRALSGIRGGFANWLERVVSAAPPPEGSGLPPQIRFPFF
jgi:hypothetical protein